MFYLYSNVQLMETATEIQPTSQTATEDVAIRVIGLSKRYLIGGEKKGSLVETLSGEMVVPIIFTPFTTTVL